MTRLLVRLGCRLAALGVVVTAALAPVHAAEPTHLAVSDEHRAVVVETGAGQVTAQISFRDRIRAVAVDNARGRVWLVTRNRHLFAYDFSGVQQLDIELPPPSAYRSDDRDDPEVDPFERGGGRDRGRGRGRGPHDSSFGGFFFRWVRHAFLPEVFLRAELTVDPDDGSVWVGAHRALFKVSAEGELVFRGKTEHNIRDLDYDARANRLWVATRTAVRARDPSGEPGPELELDGYWPRVTEIAFDDHLGALWVVRHDRLVRFDRDGNETLRWHDHGIRDIAPDGRGRLWVSNVPLLYALDAEGEIVDWVWIPWWGGWARAIDADENSHVLWAVTNRHLGRVGPDSGGHRLDTVRRIHRPKDRLDASRDIRAPTVTIEAPAEQALVRPRPELKLAYEDTGVGVATDTIAVTVNGEPIETDCEAGPAEAVCTPAKDLTDFRPAVEVTVRDRADNVSGAAAVELILDTDGDGVPDEKDVYPEDPDRSKLAPITGLEVERDGTAVRLDWDVHDDPDNTAGYRVYRTTAGADDRAVINDELLPEPGFTDDTVANGTGYIYEVFAVSTKDTESRPADPHRVFVAYNQTPVREVQARRDPIFGLVTWADAGEAFDYRVFRGEGDAEPEPLTRVAGLRLDDDGAHWSKDWTYRLATVRDFDDPFTGETVSVTGPLSEPVELAALPPLTASVQDAVETDDGVFEVVAFRDTVVVAGEFANAAGPISVTARAESDEVDAAVEDGRFRAVLPAAIESWTLTVREDLAPDRFVELPLRVRADDEPPQISVSAAETTTDAETVSVSGTATDRLTEVDGVRLRSDRFPEQRFGVTRGADGAFSGEVPLARGDNVITATATDRADNDAEASVTVQREAALAPTLVLDAPADGSVVRSDTVAVAGTVYTGHQADDVGISVSGRLRFPDRGGPVSGYPFRFEGIHLNEGFNQLTVQVQTPSGNASRSVAVTFDPTADDDEADTAGEPPALQIASPRDGAVIERDTLTVAGVVTADTDTAEVTVNGTPVALVGSPPAGASFEHSLDFSGCAEASRTVEVVAVDAEDREASASPEVTCDRAAPRLEVTTPGLQPAPATTVVNEQSLRLTGTVADANLAGLALNGRGLSLDPAGDGRSFSFSETVALPANEPRTLTLEARDRAGHATSREYRVEARLPVRIELLNPADGAEILADEGGAEVTVTARLRGLESGQTVAAALDDGAEQQMTLDGSLANTTLTTDQRSGEHRVTVRVRDEAGERVSAASAGITLMSPETAPLAVVETDPAGGAGGVAPTEPIEVYFNRAIDPELLEVDVRETVHGLDYDLANQRGKGFGEYPEPRLVEINRDLAPVPGGLAFYPGNRMVTFHPDRRFPYDAQVLVEIRHDGESIDRFRYRVQDLPTLITGAVTDQGGAAVEGVTVEIPELDLETTTNADGYFAFGSGAGRREPLPGGRLELHVNRGLDDRAYGTVERAVTVRARRLNSLDGIRLPRLNPEVPFVRIEGGEQALLAGGDLRLDLGQAELRFPDGARAGDVHVQFTESDALAAPVFTAAMPDWLYAVQPAGIAVDGRVSLTIDAPRLHGSHSYLPPVGSLVVLVGLDPDNGRIEPVGVGRIASGARIVSVEPVALGRLDYLGYALVGPDRHEVLEAFRDGEITSLATLQSRLERAAP